MPAESGKQYRFMQAVAHGMSTKKGLGPSEAVAREFIKKTPPKKRRQWSKE
jgi:hypothetical protein